MLISLQARLAYLAMTKTGSTAIEEVLRPHCEITFSRAPQLTHMNARRYRRHVVPYLKAVGIEGIETCAMLRHPIGWLASWHMYRSRPAARPGADPQAGSFEDFALAYLDDPAVQAQFSRPWDFLRNRGQGLGVDHLFRYEDPAAFRSFLEQRFGRSFLFPLKNVSPAGAPGLSLATTARLEAFFEPEMTLYETVAR